MRNQPTNPTKRHSAQGPNDIKENSMDKDLERKKTSNSPTDSSKLMEIIKYFKFKKI